MKIKLLVLFLSVIVVAACNQGSQKGSAGSGTSALNAQIDSFSYAIGADIGMNIRQSGGTELNMTAFSDGILDGLNDDSLTISKEEGRKIIQAVFQKLYQEKIKKNKEEGEAFLEENKTKEGVQVTPSGLQYIVLKEGNGPKPVDTSIVKVHYQGTLIDGTVFESSIEHGEPAKFQVRGVIPGWTEALKMMPVGSKWKLFIPTELGYGERVRRGGKIGPNMALIFEIELLEIVDPVKEKAEMERKKKEREELRKKQQEEKKKKEESNQ